MIQRICIERLGKIHNRNLFDCDEEKLNNYIQKHAGQDTKKHVCAVYVAVSFDNPSIIIGFYTLSAAQIDISNVPSEIARTLPRYPYLPAFRIGRLAINKEHQNLGVGKMLLLDALYKCFVSDVGGIAVIVDEKNEKAVSFYKKYGFIQLPEQPLNMFLPMKVIKNLFTISTSR
jgi:ribosomal protein S18 acetylase RimI-like enzyme